MSTNLQEFESYKQYLPLEAQNFNIFINLTTNKKNQILDDIADITANSKLNEVHKIANIPKECKRIFSFSRSIQFMRNKHHDSTPVMNGEKCLFV